MKYFAHFIFWCKMILVKFENEFSGISKFVEPAINVLEVIKKAIDTPAAGMVATIIDGLTNLPVAAEVKTWLDTAIPDAIVALEIMDVKPKPVDPADPSKGTIPLTIQDYLGSLAEYLKAQPDAVRNAIFLKLASLMVKAAHSEMTESEADLIVQATYTKMQNDIPVTEANTTEGTEAPASN